MTAVQRVFDTAVSAGWLILAVLALRAVLRRAPRGMICLLWALVAVRLVCPFSVHSRLSLIPDPGPIRARLVSLTETEEPVSVSGRTADVPQTPETKTETEPATAPEPAPARADGIGAARLATAVWLSGTALILAFGLASYIRLRRRVAVSLRVKGNIWLCDGIGSPFILGVFRPRIYLPSGMDREQFSYVLAHEHAHLHRGDHWAKPLGFVLAAAYWFQPLVWVAYGLFCRDMELACDERAVRDMDGWEREVYARILLACSAGPRPSVCPVRFGGVNVKERICAVLRYRRPALGAVLAVAASALLLAACFLTDPPETLADTEAAAPAPSAARRLTEADPAAPQSPTPAPDGDETFAGLLEAEWLDMGYAPLTYEEYAARYTQKLVPLDELPAGYENIGRVYVQEDPGGSGEMAVQVLYDREGQSAILVQQSGMDAGDTEPFFYYTDCDEMGVPHRDNSWFAWRAGYDGVTGGVSITMQVRSVEDLGAKNCWLILRSLWPDW